MKSAVIVMLLFAKRTVSWIRDSLRTFGLYRADIISIDEMFERYYHEREDKEAQP